MRDDEDPVRPRFEEHAGPPSPTEPAVEGRPIVMLVLPAAVAVAAGAAILAVAVTWGAAEAAVGVGAAYLVYTAVGGKGDLSGTLAVRLLTGVLRRPPPPAPGPAAPPAG